MAEAYSSYDRTPTSSLTEIQVFKRPMAKQSGCSGMVRFSRVPEMQAEQRQQQTLERHRQRAEAEVLQADYQTADSDHFRGSRGLPRERTFMRESFL